LSLKVIKLLLCMFNSFIILYNLGTKLERKKGEKKEDLNNERKT